MNNFEYLYEEYFKLEENKDRLIDRNPNLTDEQKSDVKAYFNKYPVYEKEVDWNKSNLLTYEDFKKVMTKERISKSQVKKTIKSGVKGLVEGKDYLVLGKGDFKGSPWIAYQPLTYIASRTIASNSVEPKKENGAQWCTAYQKDRIFWDIHSIKSKESFIYLCGEKIPTKKVAITASEKPMDSDGSPYEYDTETLHYNIWNFYDNNLEVFPNRLPKEVLNLIDVSYENYQLVLDNHERDVEITREILKKELLSKLTFNSETERYDYHIPNNKDEELSIYQLIEDGRFILPLGVWEGDFNCSLNNLETLENAPKKVSGNFSCSECNLESLEGAPEEVGGYFNCSYNNLTNLSGAPKEVGCDFDCSSNNLTTLEGSPEEVGGNFNCSYNNLTTLEGSPKEVGGFFSCSSSHTKFTKDYVKQICNVKNEIYT